MIISEHIRTDIDFTKGYGIARCEHTLTVIHTKRLDQHFRNVEGRHI